MSDTFHGVLIRGTSFFDCLADDIHSIGGYRRGHDGYHGKGNGNRRNEIKGKIHHDGRISGFSGDIDKSEPRINKP